MCILGKLYLVFQRKNMADMYESFFNGHFLLIFIFFNPQIFFWDFEANKYGNQHPHDPS